MPPADAPPGSLARRFLSYIKTTTEISYCSLCSWGLVASSAFVDLHSTARQLPVEVYVTKVGLLL